MKNSTNNRNSLTSILVFIFVMLILSMLFFNDASAQRIDKEINDENPHDPEFPGKQKFNAGVMTTYTYTSITPPPAIVADVTYGISRKFSAGIIAGTTGAQSLAGLKLNAALLQHNSFRVVYRMVLLYYPGRDGQYLFDRTGKFIMPWMLSMAAVNAEWEAKKVSGGRWAWECWRHIVLKE